jgi:hypothetical protein
VGEELFFCFEEVLKFGAVDEGGFDLEEEVCVCCVLPWRVRSMSETFFFMVEFQWFLMELSVRPGSIRVISAHLLP